MTKSPILTTVLLALAFGSSCVHKPAEPARNLVIICIDTLRADHLPSYGYGRPTAPGLDALGAEGTLVERAYAHAPWTVPATASLLTSTLPSEHGAGLEGDLGRNLTKSPPRKLREEVRTLGQSLQEAGFRTALLSSNPFVTGRFKRGFDFAEVKRQTAASLNDKAIAWLRDEPAERFFLYFQYIDLHAPINPPEPFFHFFEAEPGVERGEAHGNWAFTRHEAWDSPDFRAFKAHKIALYDGALRYVDSEISRLLGTLADMGRLAQTLVVVTSDHGEEFWDHGELERELAGDPRNIWGVGHGHSMFQELLHVPLLFKGPGIARNRRLDCEIGQVDVAPTVLDLLGLEKEPAMRGRSLVPLLAARSVSEPCPATPIVAESPAYGPDSRAVIWRSHKLVERRDGVTLLYDLRSDPDERHDLAARSPRQVAGLRSLADAHVISGETPGAEEQMNLDEKTREELRSLGYLGGGSEN